MKRRSGTYNIHVNLDKVDYPPRGLSMSVTWNLDRGQDPHIVAMAFGRKLASGDYVIDGPEGFEPGNQILQECAELRAQLYEARNEIAALKTSETD